MNTQTNKPLHLPLLVGGIAAILVSGIAIASPRDLAQGFNGVVAPAQAAEAAEAPALATPRHTILPVPRMRCDRVDAGNRSAAEKTGAESPGRDAGRQCGGIDAKPLPQLRNHRSHAGWIDARDQRRQTGALEAGGAGNHHSRRGSMNSVSSEAGKENAPDTAVPAAEAVALGDRRRNSSMSLALAVLAGDRAGRRALPGARVLCAFADRHSGELRAAPGGGLAQGALLAASGGRSVGADRPGRRLVLARLFAERRCRGDDRKAARGRAQIAADDDRCARRRQDAAAEHSGGRQRDPGGHGGSRPEAGEAGCRGSRARSLPFGCATMRSRSRVC